MKPAIFTALASGLVLTLSSCATRYDSQMQNIPVSYADPAVPDPGPEFDYRNQQIDGDLQVHENWPVDPGWPRMFASGTTTSFVYQPQIDSWDGRLLAARSAVIVDSPNEAKPVYGVISFKANTLVDKSERLVTLEDVQIPKADFPSAPDKAANLLSQLSRVLPEQLQSISLDYLEDSFAATEAQSKPLAQRLNNTPPKIIISERPAVLVSVDGPPVYRPVPGTELERVINTRSLLL